MSEDRLHPDSQGERPGSGAAPTPGATPGSAFSALERARRTWWRRPARPSSAARTDTLAGRARAATIDSEGSAATEVGDEPGRTETIRALGSSPRSLEIVELRDVAVTAAGDVGSADASAGGGEAPRRRLRWVGWIRRRVIHD